MKFCVQHARDGIFFCSCPLCFSVRVCVCVCVCVRECMCMCEESVKSECFICVYVNLRTKLTLQPSISYLVDPHVLPILGVKRSLLE